MSGRGNSPTQHRVLATECDSACRNFSTHPDTSLKWEWQTMSVLNRVTVWLALPGDSLEKLGWPICDGFGQDCRVVGALLVAQCTETGRCLALQMPPLRWLASPVLVCVVVHQGGWVDMDQGCETTGVVACRLRRGVSTRPCPHKSNRVGEATNFRHPSLPLESLSCPLLLFVLAFFLATWSRNSLKQRTLCKTDFPTLILNSTVILSRAVSNAAVSGVHASVTTSARFTGFLRTR